MVVTPHACRSERTAIDLGEVNSATSEYALKTLTFPYSWAIRRIPFVTEKLSETPGISQFSASASQRKMNMIDD